MSRSCPTPERPWAAHPSRPSRVASGVRRRGGARYLGLRTRPLCTERHAHERLADRGLRSCGADRLQGGSALAARGARADRLVDPVRVLLVSRDRHVPERRRPQRRRGLPHPDRRGCRQGFPRLLPGQRSYARRPSGRDLLLRDTRPAPARVSRAERPAASLRHERRRRTGDRGRSHHRGRCSRSASTLAPGAREVRAVVRLSPSADARARRSPTHAAAVPARYSPTHAAAVPPRCSPSRAAAAPPAVEAASANLSPSRHRPVRIAQRAGRGERLPGLEQRLQAGEDHRPAAVEFAAGALA